MLFSMFRLQGDRTILFQMSDISLFDMFEPRSGDGVSTSVPLPYKEDGCAPPRKKWKVEPKENISCKFRHIFLHFQFLFFSCALLYTWQSIAMLSDDGNRLAHG